MEPREKLALLQQQIDEASEGTPANFELWRQKTEVVLRNVVGDANPLYKSFKEVRYSLSVFSTDTPDSAFEKARISGVRQAIAVLEAAKLEVEVGGGLPDVPQSAAAGGRAIFIVHGSNEARKHEVARFLRSLTGNEPVILHEQASEGRTIIEQFEKHATGAGYAVVIATADDLGRASSASTDKPRARQNVVFELGFFFGALGRSKVALLYEDGLERPSDTDGIVRVKLDSGGAWKLAITRELEAAGIGVDWTALR